MPDELPENSNPDEFNPEQPGGPALEPGQSFLSQQADKAKGKVSQKAGEAVAKQVGKKVAGKAAGEAAADVTAAGTGGIGAVLRPIIKWVTEKIVNKLLSKDWWKVILKLYWPQIAAFVIIIIIAIFAITIISQAYRGYWGRGQVQAASIYNADDAALIQQLLGQNTGGMICPLLRKGKSDIVSPWAKNRGGYIHRGIDISAPNQTPLYAATDGKVVYLKDDLANNVKGYTDAANGGFGNTIIVQVSGGNWDGFFWEIHHLYPQSATNAGISLGSNVKKGQLIGGVGDNGASSGPHMHFQVDIPTMVQGNRTQSGCSNVILEGGRPCGAGASNRYHPELDTVNPIIPLGW